MTDPKKLFTPLFGLGIAGNSAGHLQQTGEINGLSAIDDAAKPQALFPFFVANAKSAYLTCMPYSSTQLHLPKALDAKVQMEAELGLKLAVVYNAEGDVTQLTAISMTVINDATYRNASVGKLAEKKNWGIATKGIAEHDIPIDNFVEGGELDHFRLCGFHQSNGQWQLCGQDTAITEYTYFYQALLQWLLKQIRQQQDKNALHNIQDLLSQADYPEQILISIGATRYSDYGEQHYLSSGDQLVVALYDSRAYHFQTLVSLLEKTGSLKGLSNNKIIFLQQQVV
ncbi:conserved hypothetical protein [Psychromonas ingrahamii 37]|uniref:Uncharacterized protein n=1 Tax=Psychromonas ingrahamii (strain DSM 17664 / CCUG 51855 / 37) TaxID=357804 RepID=A1SXD9_PSYIN|nr:DUF5718 family protein [Psychromonas ingrahamii]ABM04154.1 conserved hypothetical protein [Psychromonas ingrahamii 37]